MNKIEYLAAIKDRIVHLPPSETDAYLSYYAEMIDDRVEEGMSEEEAINEIGTVDEVVAQILSEAPQQTKRVKEKRSFSPLVIVLLVLGSPVWLSLLIAAVAVFLSAYIVIWSVIISLYAVDIAVGLSGLAGIISCLALSVTGSSASAILLAGGGLVCIGVSILMFFLCSALAKLTVWVSKMLFRGAKFILTGGRCR